MSIPNSFIEVPKHSATVENEYFKIQIIAKAGEGCEFDELKQMIKQCCLGLGYCENTVNKQFGDLED